jgi:hypothetical protein
MSHMQIFEKQAQYCYIVVCCDDYILSRYQRQTYPPSSVIIMPP